MLLNSLVCVWLRAISSEVAVPHTVPPRGYADDVHATASSVSAIQQAVDITQEYAELSGQVIRPDKSFAFVVTPEQRKRLSPRLPCW